jgi:hypothetical protein
MKIIRNRQQHGSLSPRAENIIAAIPYDYLHHELHEIKHPLTVYRSSLGRITTAWLKVFPLHEGLFFEAACNVELTKYPSLLEAYETLLFRLNEHVDVCHEVLRALRPPIHGKSYDSHARFLWGTKLPGFRAFADCVHAGYREQHIGLLVNEMKHASAQLRGLCGRTENSVVLGYFLDGAQARGSVGPNSRVHKKYRGMHTGFSFSRDMLMHFWWIYRASEALSRSIEMTMLADHGFKIDEMRSQLAPHQQWDDLCLGCSRLQPSFFLDECEKPYPRVVCPPDASAMSMEFPTSLRATPYKQMRITMTTDFPAGRGGLAVPYFRPS